MSTPKIIHTDSPTMENHHALPGITDTTYYLICRFCNEFKSRAMFADKTTSSCEHTFDSFEQIIAQLKHGAPNNDFLALTPENAICIACLHAHVSAAKTSRIPCPLSSRTSGPCRAKFKAGDIQRLLTNAEFKLYVGLVKKERRAPPKTIVCTVCFEPLSATTLPRQRVTAGCKHEMTVCESCVRGSIVATMTDANWEHPRCPECAAVLSHGEITAFVERAVMARHDERVFLASMAQVPEFRWCLRAGCGAGQLHEGGAESPIVTCRKCGKKMCFVHGVRWHEGQTCAAEKAEKERREEEEEEEEAGTKATLEHLRRKTKACPRRGCGIRIEKNGGCDHMKCRKCGLDFSWKSAR